MFVLQTLGFTVGTVGMGLGFAAVDGKWEAETSGEPALPALALALHAGFCPAWVRLIKPHRCHIRGLY